MITYIATALVDLMVGLIALSRRKNPAALALALFALSLGLWQTELFLLSTISDVEQLAPWFHLTRTGMFFAPMFLALLTWRICGSSSEPFRKYVLIPGFAGAAIVSLLNNTILPSELVAADSGYLPKPDIVLYLFLVLIIAGIPGSIVLAVLRRRKAPEREKRRIKWLLISLLWIFVFSISSIWLAAQLGSYLNGLLGAVSNAVFVGVLLYASINHHLTDVGSAISMLFARIIALIGTLGLYFYAVSKLKGWVDDRDAAIGFGVILLILALEFYPRLLRLIHPGARKLMVSGGYDLISVKRAIQVAFKRSLEVEDLQNVLDHYIKSVMRISSYEVTLAYKGEDTTGLTLRAMGSDVVDDIIDVEDLAQISNKSAHLVMIDEAEPALESLMRKRGAIACLPLKYEEQLVGVLFVGPLDSYRSQYYRHDDIQLLEWLMVELPATLSRVVLHDTLLNDLDEAHKTMSLIELMNQYHHDIKAPLSIIDGVVSNDLYDRDKQHRVILEQVARGTQLITMMSNILRGQRERQTRPVDLSEVISGCILLFEREVDEIHTKLDEMGDVVGDANDLKILFINLIKNAVEAKQPDRPLHISIFGGESEECVWISVQDNGCGMSASQVERLWTNTDSTKAEGSGIGLRAVKRIADEHGAQVDVQSTPGQGTVFTLRFSMRVKLGDDISEGVAL